ncbi:endosome-associated-trafficking regulator 1 [Macrosteles quadrilineatus]|uniref:endosome-associated-trafficking regulator 1 n=1 Tax=Macrosteles quadrilineatus TaxID=74068 RepID=UPI0023E3297A|nr:endosome-associated-trafficking regulator 1 [Macrosteles quadrilineatus]
MADKNDGKGNGSNNYYRTNSNSNNGEDNSDDENIQGASVGPDIGLGNSNQMRNSATETGQAGTSSGGDPPRREDNPFSFKHFLNPEPLFGGARPKVYPTKSPSSSRIINNPELASGLPDFVQDHLVIEQCYLNQNQPSSLSVDMNRLAEFGLEASNDSWNPSRSGELPFDLTATRHERPEAPHLPLDLPEGLPFDLPSKPPGAEVGASTSLPDFLSDGPIHSGRRDVTQPPSEPSSPSIPASHSHIQSLQMENERLRRDQETLRRQLSDQIRRNESLDAELRALRSRDREDTASLENMVRQAEENLLRTTRRAETAEMKAAKLKQEVKLLTMELSGNIRGAHGPAADRTSDHRLAAELRTAVTSAELSLRQMLSGVDTLRMIASTLENRHRFEEQHEFSESESRDRDDSGPAL